MWTNHDRRGRVGARRRTREGLCGHDRILRRGEDMGLYFAGDSLTGRARVPLALKSGLATARRLVARTSGKRVVIRKAS